MVWKATGRPDACDIIHKHVHGARTWKDVAKCELGVPGREEAAPLPQTKPKLASFASLLVRTHEVSYWGSKTALFCRDGTRGRPKPAVVFVRRLEPFERASTGGAMGLDGLARVTRPFTRVSMIARVAADFFCVGLPAR